METHVIDHIGSYTVCKSILVLAFLPGQLYVLTADEYIELAMDLLSFACIYITYISMLGSAIPKNDLRELTCQYPSHIKSGAK